MLPTKPLFKRQLRCGTFQLFCNYLAPSSSQWHCLCTTPLTEPTTRDDTEQMCNEYNRSFSYYGLTCFMQNEGLTSVDINCTLSTYLLTFLKKHMKYLCIFKLSSNLRIGSQILAMGGNHIALCTYMADSFRSFMLS